MWYTMRFGSMRWPGTMGRITCSITSCRICSWDTSGLCWVEMTTVSTPTGLPST
jgi:hypothetical protein